MASDPCLHALAAIRRTVGDFDVRLSPTESADGLDVFETEASGGVLRISGSSAVAMCRGFYEYLKSACHRQLSWSGAPISAPDQSPDQSYRKVVCPNRYR